MTNNKATKKAVSKNEKYSPSDSEYAFVMKHFERQKGVKAPKVKVEANGNNVGMRPNHPDVTAWHAFFEETYGTANADFAIFQNNLMANVLQEKGTVSEGDINAALAIMFGISPKDEIESMLATQMVAIHVSTMKAASRLNKAELIPQHDSALNAMNKLARTFTTQMEALNKYRGKGQQKMTVEHVHVHEGGQAIVGSVEGGGKSK